MDEPVIGAGDMVDSSDTKGPRDDLPVARHWEAVYETRPATSVSWYQVKPGLSLAMIESAVPHHAAAIIDVGGGASTLVDALSGAGYTDISVLDISATALRTSRERLARPLPGIHWIESDVLAFQPPRRYDLWHDRALFHFMTGDSQRERYRSVLGEALAPGGKAIIATFAMDGPERCSGLRVRRYDAPRLLQALGRDFVLLEEHREEHLTPDGALQPFAYFLVQRG